jgi:hypothetical protein
MDTKDTKEYANSFVSLVSFVIGLFYFLGALSVLRGEKLSLQG